MESSRREKAPVANRSFSDVIDRHDSGMRGNASSSLNKKVYAVHMILRAGLVLVVAFVIRILSFTTTIFPSPSDHCYPGDPDYNVCLVL